jgi:selenide,water dikinase
MARASDARFVFDAAALPALPGALELARAGVETGGAAHNRRFVAPWLELPTDVPVEFSVLAHDPQTSGGLLAAVPADRVASVQSVLAAAGVESWRVGRVEAGSGVALAMPL